MKTPGRPPPDPGASHDARSAAAGADAGSADARAADARAAQAVGAPPGGAGARPVAHDEARKRILARRATFVAAALAGVTTACGKEPAPAQPCLMPPLVVVDASPEPCLSPSEPELPPDAALPPPQPCLTPVRPPEVTADAGGSAPMPCLSVRAPTPDAGKPKPPPRPCLKVAPPRGQ